jgi:hypothetical protein
VCSSVTSVSTPSLPFRSSKLTVTRVSGSDAIGCVSHFQVNVSRSGALISRYSPLTVTGSDARCFIVTL